MASERERLEAMAEGDWNFGYPDRHELESICRRLLALPAAAEKAEHLVDENNDVAVQLAGSFGLQAALHAAIADFDKEP